MNNEAVKNRLKTLERIFNMPQAFSRAIQEDKDLVQAMHKLYKLPNGEEELKSIINSAFISEEQYRITNAQVLICKMLNNINAIPVQSDRGISWPCFDNNISSFTIKNLTWGALDQNTKSTKFIESCGVFYNKEYVLLKPQDLSGNDLGKLEKNNKARIRIISITKVGDYKAPLITDCPNFSPEGSVLTGIGSGGGGGEVHGEKSGMFLVYNFLEKHFLDNPKVHKDLLINTWVYKGDSEDQKIASNLCGGCRGLFKQAAAGFGYRQTNWKNPFDHLKGGSKSLEKAFSEWKKLDV